MGVKLGVILGQQIRRWKGDGKW